MKKYFRVSDPVLTPNQQLTVALNYRRLFAGMGILGLSLLLLTGCAIPGGYSPDSLRQIPESSLAYPNSTDVKTSNYAGSPGNYVSKGAAAEIDGSGTTVHTQLEVLNYFSKVLAADGWIEESKSDNETTPDGIPAKDIVWVKGKLNLYYQITVWTVGETTHYETHLGVSVY